MVLTKKLFTIPQCDMSRSFFLNKVKSRISSKKEISGSEQRLDESIVQHNHDFLLGSLRAFRMAFAYSKTEG